MVWGQFRVTVSVATAGRANTCIGSLSRGQPEDGHVVVNQDSNDIHDQWSGHDRGVHAKSLERQRQDLATISRGIRRRATIAPLAIFPVEYRSHDADCVEQSTPIPGQVVGHKKSPADLSQPGCELFAWTEILAAN